MPSAPLAVVAMTALAYRGDEPKASVIARLERHRALDQVIQGAYWEGDGDGRGCAVGCLTHDPTGGHGSFPERWGVPVQLAYLIDQIHESLPVEDARDWPLRVMGAIPEGADLSRVWDRWCAWMLRRLVPSAGASAAVVEVMASLFERAGTGDEPSAAEWGEAARAAWAAGAAGAARRKEWARAAADELVRLVSA
jgi:hypothetical protein